MEATHTIGMYGGARREMEDSWRMVRTLREGTDGMRQERNRYTPQTAREIKQPKLYNERLAQSVLYNVYEETITRIAALPFEKPPVIVGDLPPELEAIENDADRCGNSLSVFLASIYQDAVNSGMGMFLVDHVSTIKDGGEVMRADEADAEDVRPYFSRIDPDNYVGSKHRTTNGREVCTELRVREWGYKTASDGAGEELVERIRKWTEETVELWERNYGSTTAASDRQAKAGQGDSSGFTQVEPPKPHGFPDNKIPLVVMYTRKRGFLHARPPLLPLAHLNVKHWNQQSIHDNALRYCLSPVLFGKGLTRTEQEQKPSTGEGATLLSTSEQAQLSFVEISGTSLGQSSKQIDKTEQRMRAAAVEPLMAGAATATGEVRAELKDQSEAQRWVEGMEWAAYNAYQLASRWGYELPEDFNITLHRASSLMQAANPARTAALQNDAKEGRLTLLTYLKERARSGEFADDFDAEAEAEAIEQEKAANIERQMAQMVATIESERPGAEGEEPGQPPVPQPNEQPAFA